MLTKYQYKFLKEFIKLSKECKKKEMSLAYFNREKVPIEYLKKLLIKFPDLLPSDPLTEKCSKYNLEETSLISYINDYYLKQIGLYDCIIYIQPCNYGISSNGLKAMEEYKKEQITKFRIPLLSIIIAISSLVVSISAIIVSAISNK